MRRERGERQRQKAEVNINVKMSGRRRDRTGFCMEFSCTVSTSAPLARIKFFSLSLSSLLSLHQEGNLLKGFLPLSKKTPVVIGNRIPGRPSRNKYIQNKQNLITLKRTVKLKFKKSAHHICITWRDSISRSIHSNPVEVGDDTTLPGHIKLT
jgi:hypothetical protein